MVGQGSYSPRRVGNIVLQRRTEQQTGQAYTALGAREIFGPLLIHNLHEAQSPVYFLVVCSVVGFVFCSVCGYQAPFPWIVIPHCTQVQGHQRYLTPFREDTRHRPHLGVSTPQPQGEPARGSAPHVYRFVCFFVAELLARQHVPPLHRVYIYGTMYGIPSPKKSI